MTKYWLCNTELTCHETGGVRISVALSSGECSTATFGTSSVGPGFYGAWETSPVVVNLMVDWREDATSTYFYFSSVLVDFSTNEIDSDVPQLSSFATVQRHRASRTYYTYNASTIQRLDLVHVYRKPGVYNPVLRLDSNTGGAVQCYCRDSDEYHVCSSGDATQDSICEGVYPFYIGRDGSCSPTPMDTNPLRLAPILWSGTFVLAGAILGIVAYRRFRVSQGSEASSYHSFPRSIRMSDTPQVS